MLNRGGGGANEEIHVGFYYILKTKFCVKCELM